mmetsp:Transcript_3124/g.7069  ORF Transcript_3124/g.7069 Transcript_3124/m.7069 type:complete len:406 (-) Transcript_3124:39-1256(-)
MSVGVLARFVLASRAPTLTVDRDAFQLGGAQARMDSAQYLPSLNNLSRKDFPFELRQLVRQLRLQNAENSCLPRDKAGVKCAGLGTMLLMLAVHLANATCAGHGLDVIEDKRCAWFHADQSQKCSHLMGCYVPTLQRPPHMNKPLLENVGSGCGAHNGSAQSSNWFLLRWGKVAHLAGVMHYVLTEDERTAPVSIPRLNINDDCIAVHVRRGDACLNPDRECHEYDDYLGAALTIKRLYGLQRLYVMTDDTGVPLTKWGGHFRSVSQASIERSGYDVSNITHSAVRRYKKVADRTTFPENRVASGVLGSQPVAEYFSDFKSGSRCRALVGSFSSSTTKLLLLQMITRHGMMPPYVSLGGCLEQVVSTEYTESERCRPDKKMLKVSVRESIHGRIAAAAASAAARL